MSTTFALPASATCYGVFGLFKEIASNSMLPTLYQEDCVLIRYFSPDSQIERGDIVLHVSDGGVLAGTEKQLVIRRVLGLPGDTVFLPPFQPPTVNGEALKWRRVGELEYDLYSGERPAWMSDFPQDKLKISEECLPNGRCYFVGSDEGLGRIGTSLCERTECTVPEGEFFLVGDNRTNSYDSRAAELGTFDRQSILGIVHTRLQGPNEETNERKIDDLPFVVEHVVVSE